MWKKVLLLAGVGVAAVLVAKKIKDVSEDRELWHEATNTPDLR